MKFTMKKIFTVALIVSGVYIGYSCGDGSANKEAKNESDSAMELRKEPKVEREEAGVNRLVEKDSQEVVKAFVANLSEIKLANVAKTHARTDAAKTLANTLYEAHSKFENKLRDLAHKKQIDLPTDVTPEEQRKIDNLVKEKPENFDREYADLMVKKHKDAVDMFEDCAEKCSDQDIRDLFGSAVPDLRKHLEAAKTTEQKIKDMKK